MMYERAIVNEVLCYVTQYIQSSTKDQVLKVVQGFYNVDEVICAKEMLYRLYEGKLGSYPQRKTSTQRSELFAHTDDIVNFVLQLDSQGVSLNFSAKNLHRIPKWAPNETGNFSIAEKLNQLEGRMQSLEFVVSENKVSCVSLKDSVVTIERRLEKTEVMLVGERSVEQHTHTTPWEERQAARRAGAAWPPIRRPTCRGST